MTAAFAAGPPAATRSASATSFSSAAGTWSTVCTTSSVANPQTSTVPGALSADGAPAERIARRRDAPADGASGLDADGRQSHRARLRADVVGHGPRVGARASGRPRLGTGLCRPGGTVAYGVSMTYVEDPRTAPPIRWGILGPGGIAHTFAAAVNAYTRAQLVAVGSRNKDRAERFATQHGIPTTHVGYEALVEDPQVDAVYVASPHSEHREHALLAIAAGKHVLVEKAFTRNAAEAQEIVDAARAAGVFCMEAMWTRFLPHVVALRSVLARGDIGTVVGLIADHGQSFATRPATHRHPQPRARRRRAPGPRRLPGVLRARPARRPGHDQGRRLAHPDRGRRADLHRARLRPATSRPRCTRRSYAKTATTAVIFGQEGRIEIAGDFYRPTSFTVTRDDGSWWSYDREVDGGFQYQAAEVARRIAAGETESPRHHPGQLARGDADARRDPPPGRRRLPRGVRRARRPRDPRGRRPHAGPNLSPPPGPGRPRPGRPVPEPG